jgi:RNA polymerase sigma factor (sigma-70 family)
MWLSSFVQYRDEAAFEALFREYYPRITRLLVTLVGDQAEDVAQATFLQLYRHPPRESGEVGAWLCRVATHLGYNALRGRRRWRQYRDLLATLTDGAGWQEQAPSPEERTQQREMEQQVRAALRQLKEREATILALRYSGQSYQEIAAVLGVSVSSVGTLLARAERAFSKVYARMEQEAER